MLQQKTPIIGLIIISAIAIALVRKHTFWFLDDLAFGFLTANLLVGLSADRLPYCRRILSHKSLTSIGIFAYTLYLFHAPLLQLVTVLFLHPLKTTVLNEFLFMFGVGAPAIVLLAYILFYAVEKPFMALTRKIK
jgi:peptidoglycan/LPS O-acetylase OafA/YrhL